MNNKYYKGYLKYKNLYGRAKVGKSVEDNFLRPVDLYLFFDLLQCSTEIKDMLTHMSAKLVIVLVGHTPSYLKPFLEYFGFNTFNLAMSSKAYGNLFQPNAVEDKRYNFIYCPTDDQETSYFNYLNTTDFSKQFVKDSWNKLVLIDYSSGPSIHGVSIFLNRYVGNMVDCKNITETIHLAKPLRFIGCISHNMHLLYTNINPKISKEINAGMTVDKVFGYTNYDPNLIIYIGSVYFNHVDYFLYTQLYRRYVPFYPILSWDLAKPSYLNDGLKVIDVLSKLITSYFKFTEKKSNGKKLLKYLKTLGKLDKHHESMLKNVSSDKQLLKFLNTVYDYVLTELYKHIEYSSN